MATPASPPPGQGLLPLVTSACSIPLRVRQEPVEEWEGEPTLRRFRIGRGANGRGEGGFRGTGNTAMSLGRCSKLFERFVGVPCGLREPRSCSAQTDIAELDCRCSRERRETRCERSSRLQCARRADRTPMSSQPDTRSSSMRCETRLSLSLFALFALLQLDYSATARWLDNTIQHRSSISLLCTFTSHQPRHHRSQRLLQPRSPLLTSFQRLSLRYSSRLRMIG